MHPIYYWSSAIGKQALLDEHQEALNKLLNGDYSPTDLEKLHGSKSDNPVYSFRLNCVARLLFTTRKTQDKSNYMYSSALKHMITKKVVSSKMACFIATLKTKQTNWYLPPLTTMKRDLHLTPV